MGYLCRIQLGVIQPNTIFGLHMLGQLRELVLISDVFQRDQLMNIQGNISKVAALMKPI